MGDDEEGTTRFARSGKNEASRPKAAQRQATVYDAVAGRVSVRSFISQPSAITESGDVPGFSSFPLSPEEALFRRHNAPTRYMENDFYFANESLPPDCPLPDSDLLKAVHTYSSDFYNHANLDRGRTSWRSMDETALIALGILLEETAKESLGETGDMVFAEGEEVSDAEIAISGNESAIAPGRVRKRRDTRSSGRPRGPGAELVRFRQGRGRKRRRVERPRVLSPSRSTDIAEP